MATLAQAFSGCIRGKMPQVPATLTPETAVLLTEIFAEAGVPPGVLNLVLGSGSDAGDEIVSHPAVKAISFTGSTETGLKLYAQAAPRGQGRRRSGRRAGC